MWKIVGHADAGLFPTEGAAIARAWQLADHEGLLERATVHEVHDDFVGQLGTEQAGSGPATAVPDAVLTESDIEVEVWMAWDPDLLRGLLALPPTMTAGAEPTGTRVTGMAVSKSISTTQFRDARLSEAIVDRVRHELRHRLHEVAAERGLSLSQDDPEMKRHELASGSIQLFRMETKATD